MNLTADDRKEMRRMQKGSKRIFILGEMKHKSVKVVLIPCQIRTEIIEADVS